MASVTIRIDDKLKKEATEVANRYGLDLPATLKMLTVYIKNTGTIPVNLKDRFYEDEKNHEKTSELFKKHLKKKRVKVYKFEKGANGNLKIPKDFPKKLVEAWEM